MKLAVFAVAILLTGASLPVLAQEMPEFQEPDKPSPDLPELTVDETAAPAPKPVAPKAQEAQTLKMKPETVDANVLEMKPETVDGNVMEMKADIIEGNVMEMQADVISADRKPSPVFVEPGSVDAGTGAVIFQRPNFNDFHDMQKKWRVKPHTTDGK